MLGTGLGATAFAVELKEDSGHAPAFRDSTAYDAAAALMLSALVNLPSTDPGAITGLQIRNGMRLINQPQGTHVSAGKAGLAAAVALITAQKPINYDGASGPCDFDALGNVLADVTRFEFKDSTFVDVQRFACTKSAKCSPDP